VSSRWEGGAAAGPTARRKIAPGTDRVLVPFSRARSGAVNVPKGTGRVKQGNGVYPHVDDPHCKEMLTALTPRRTFAREPVSMVCVDPRCWMPPSFVLCRPIPPALALMPLRPPAFRVT